MASANPERIRGLTGEAARLRGAAKELRAAPPGLKKAALRVQPARPASRRSLGEDHDRTVRLNRMLAQAEEVAAYFAEISEETQGLRRHLNPPHEPGHVWQQAFAERLGYCWRDLTGHHPSPTSDEFIDFLDAAFVGLGGAADILSWRGPARIAVERVMGVKKKGEEERVGGRLEWDQFDRLERQMTPPGGEMQVLPISEHHARTKRRQERFKGHVLAWLDAATPEAKRAASLDLIGHWTFLPEAEENRDEVARIADARKAGTLESVRVSHV